MQFTSRVVMDGRQGEKLSLTCTPIAEEDLLGGRAYFARNAELRTSEGILVDSFQVSTTFESRDKWNAIPGNSLDLDVLLDHEAQVIAQEFIDGQNKIHHEVVGGVRLYTIDPERKNQNGEFFYAPFNGPR